MKIALKILVGLILPLLFASCQDHIVPPGSKRFRIVSVASQSPARSGGSTSITFRYDATNKLISYSYRGWGLTIDSRDRTTTLQYDGQGRLVSEQTRYDDGFMFTGYVFARTTYVYDAQGRLALIQGAYDSNNTGTFFAGSPNTFEYGAGKVPTKVTTTSTSSTLVTQYTYSNENVVRIDGTTFSTTGAPVTLTTTYGPYDNTPNPFYGLTPTTLNVVMLYDTYSKNNLVGQADTKYVYDANGLLVQRDYGNIGGVAYYKAETFSYEAY